MKAVTPTVSPEQEIALLNQRVQSLQRELEQTQTYLHQLETWWLGSYVGFTEPTRVAPAQMPSSVQAPEQMGEFHRLSDVIHAAPMAIVVSDQAGLIVLTNNQVETLFGYESAELIQQPVEILVPESARAAHVRHRLAYLAKPKSRKMTGDLVLTARCKDGRIIPVEIQLSFLKTATGPLVMNFIIDLAARQQAEIALQQALQAERELSELKSNFITTASHEFRTPLAVIMSTADALRASLHQLADHQIEQRLSRINKQVQHLRSIMDDVLDLGRMQAKRVSFKPVPYHPAPLCFDLVTEFQTLFETRHQFLYTCDENLRVMQLDAHLLRQILSNLISNAVKYSAIDKPIAIDVAYREDTLILTVSDSGIGIPAADMKHLFQPFYRATNVGNIPGTGLGLSIAKEAAALHGGFITVESQVDVGSRFTFTIPAI